MIDETQKAQIIVLTEDVAGSVLHDAPERLCVVWPQTTDLFGQHTQCCEDAIFGLSLLEVLR